MIKITKNLLSEISEKAKLAKRKRANYNFHKGSDDLIQRFLNAIEPDTYLRPHKHENPDKIEIFIILTGRVLIVQYDDEGGISDHIILDPRNGNMGVEIQPRTWHSFISLQKGSVLYELKEGPYDESIDKIFAIWSPKEESPEALDYNKKILNQLKI